MQMQDIVLWSGVTFRINASFSLDELWQSTLARRDAASLVRDYSVEVRCDPDAHETCVTVARGDVAEAGGAIVEREPAGAMMCTAFVKNARELRALGLLLLRAAEQYEVVEPRGAKEGAFLSPLNLAPDALEESAEFFGAHAESARKPVE